MFNFFDGLRPCLIQSWARLIVHDFCSAFQALMYVKIMFHHHHLYHHHHHHHYLHYHHHHHYLKEFLVIHIVIVIIIFLFYFILFLHETLKTQRLVFSS